jgi:hypothetical protein
MGYLAEEDKAAGCDHFGNGRGGEAAIGYPECEGLSGRDAWSESSVQNLKESGSRFALTATSQNRGMGHPNFGELRCGSNPHFCVWATRYLESDTMLECLD